MIKNDPFKSRSDVTKTILQYNLDDTRRLIDFIAHLNPGLSRRECYEYFVSLYKKFPDDFEFVQNGNDGHSYVFFFKLKVSSFREGLGDIHNIKSFFEHWEYLVNRMDVIYEGDDYD